MSELPFVHVSLVEVLWSCPAFGADALGVNDLGARVLDGGAGPVGQVVGRAFVVLRGGVEPSDALVADLRAHVKRENAPYRYPRLIVFVPELPDTISGTIPRRELRDRKRDAPWRRAAPAEPA